MATQYLDNPIITNFINQMYDKKGIDVYDWLTFHGNFNQLEEEAIRRYKDIILSNELNKLNEMDVS